MQIEIFSKVKAPRVLGKVKHELFSMMDTNLIFEGLKTKETR